MKTIKKSQINYFIFIKNLCYNFIQITKLFIIKSEEEGFYDFIIIKIRG